MITTKTSAAMVKTNPCELCSLEASLYCAADSAFLCYSCDEKVHAANFLVARHVRQIICPACRSLSGSRLSGAVAKTAASWCCCPSCCSTSSTCCSSSSLDCVSSCESSSTAAREEKKRRIGTRTRMRMRRRNGVFKTGEAEGVFVNWCEKLGLNGNFKKAIVSSACSAMALCLERLTVIPFRVSLAASFWFGVRTSSSMTWQSLRRVEQVSGVPSKLIVAVEMRLARAVTLRRTQRPCLEEGWADSGDLHA